MSEEGLLSAVCAADARRLKLASNRIWLSVLAYYAIIVFSLALARAALRSGISASSLAASAFAIVVIGWCQFAIAGNAFHEAIHKNFGSPHREVLALLLSAYPFGLTRAYRDVHLEHHRHFGDPSLDPDYASYSGFPKTRAELVGRLLRNATGAAAIIQFFTQAPKQSRVNPTTERVWLLGVQIVVALSLTAAVGWYAYPLFWILPMVTIAKLCSSTRAFCEHGSPNDEPVIRTITGSFFQTVTLGAFSFNYHAEHHYRAFIPYTRLAEANRVLGGELAQRSDFVRFHGGYAALLLYWFRQLPWRRSDAGRVS